MKSRISNTFLIPVLFFGGIISAQTINTGELYVTPNTQFSTVGAFDNTPSGVFINDGESFIYNHFNNDGVVDFTPGETGYTRFEGAAVQQLTGSNISYFYDVLFNNPSSTTASFELSSEISVDNEAEFNQGIVKDDDFGGLMIFEVNGYHTGTFDGSHVDGLVQKNGNTEFTYPIGDAGYYRFAAISAPDNINDVFTGKYFFENSNPIHPHSSKEGVIELIDNAEYWTIERTVGTTEGMVTLSWREETTPAEIYATPVEAIHIVRWDETEQLWLDEGGVADANAKTVTTIVRDYGVFTLARVKTEDILPCGLVVYNAVSSDQDGQNDFFNIQQLNDDSECATNMKISIFNRWGVKVYETDNYETGTNLFRGYSDGRTTISGGEQLPTGTYFYVLNFDYRVNGEVRQYNKTGYLYLVSK
ncbi:gliding motility-associated C-terminal domain-containing protein [Flavobacterium sp. NRK F10]|uniref:gliding motility-associated C-terminal domain-containing protein n=1 Tax=Flavobacterium sp. NRK F10 TaxID=2954931 RepID=UPI0020914B5B|nr:gliding motility-associated C-terminal domain-containing protein [Flavobacterium sp. NRK F10]MCO6175398.1 gliding motility-associated C-terminal domain-containing protein [Flavobacterium sp. NRK F10]